MYNGRANNKYAANPCTPVLLQADSHLLCSRRDTNELAESMSHQLSTILHTSSSSVTTPHTTSSVSRVIRTAVSALASYWRRRFPFLRGCSGRAHWTQQNTKYFQSSNEVYIPDVIIDLSSFRPTCQRLRVSAHPASSLRLSCFRCSVLPIRAVFQNFVFPNYRPPQPTPTREIMITRSPRRNASRARTTLNLHFSCLG